MRETGSGGRPGSIPGGQLRNQLGGQLRHQIRRRSRRHRDLRLQKHGCGQTSRSGNDRLNSRDRNLSRDRNRLVQEVRSRSRRYPGNPGRPRLRGDRRALVAAAEPAGNQEQQESQPQN